MKRFFLFFTLLALLSGCGKDDEPKPEPTPNPPSQNDPDNPDNPDNEKINITLAPTTLSFEVQGGTLDLTVTCTTGKTWTLSGGESWCTASGTNGSNGATVTFTVEANTSPDERNATYTFTCGDKTAKLVVTQKQQTVTTVHVPTKGTLASVLAENNLEASSIVLLKITGEINDMDILKIQEMTNLMNLDISGTNLTELPAGAFNEFMNLKKVILPSTLTSIGKSAFRESGLQSIEIPASVETIGNGAFYNCKALTTVTFEKGSQLKKIQGGVDNDIVCGTFMRCTSLTSIEIPASVETIESTAFSYCKALTTVTFEKGSQLKTIQGDVYNNIVYGAFLHCTSLTSIEIPASVETIESIVFNDCTALTTVTFEKGSRLKTIGETPNTVFNTFYNCTSLTDIEIPASVETIGSYAFYNCKALTTVTFGKGSQLKTIDKYAFENCHNLKTVDMSACTQVENIDHPFYDCNSLQLFKIGRIKPPSIWSNTFSDLPNFSILKVPAESVEAYKKANGWNKFSSISALD